MDEKMKAERVALMEDHILRQLEEARDFESESDEYRTALKNVSSLQGLLEKEVSLDKLEKLSEIQINRAAADLDVVKRSISLEEKRYDFDCGHEEWIQDHAERKMVMEEKRYEIENGEISRKAAFEERKFEREMENEERRIEIERMKARMVGKPKFDWNAVLLAGANIVGIAIIVLAEVAGERIISSKALKYAGNFKF